MVVSPAPWAWAGRPNKLALGLLASLLLHAAVLLRIVQPQGSIDSREQSVPVQVTVVRMDAEMLTDGRVPQAQTPPAPAAETAVPLPEPMPAPAVTAVPAPLAVARDNVPVPPPLSAEQVARTDPPVPTAPTPVPGISPNAPVAAPATAYNTAGSLSPPPRLLTEIDTENTPVVEDGKVTVKVLINENGTVDEVVVLRSIPRGRYDSAAIASFSKARYTPGYLNGRPVKSQVSYEIDYLPTNRGSAVSGQSN